MNTDDRTNEPTDGRSRAEGTVPERYEIRVSGRLGSRWTAWFDGLTLTNTDDGTTVISGPIVDQAALHGLLQKLRDLGIPLLSLTRTAPGGATEATISPTTADRTNTPGATS